MLNADTVLYAKWQQVFTVSFVTNGGTSIATISTGYLESSPATTKAGATFAGLYTDSALTGSSRVTFPYTVTSDMTLYAKWELPYTEMVTVSAGSFYLVDPSSSSERPKINLSAFQIAKYELTYELWQEVYNWAKNNGYNMTKAKKGYAANDQYKSSVPATDISWNMACVCFSAFEYGSKKKLRTI